MRCNNCGWLNADGESHCIKCNSPLADKKMPVRPAEAVRETPAGDPATSGEDSVSGRDVSAEIIECPACQYPASSRVHHCPMCGSPLDAAPAAGGNGGKPSVAMEGNAAAVKKDVGELGTGGEGTVDPFRAPESTEPAREEQSGMTAPAKKPQPVLSLERVGRPGESSKTMSFEAAEDQVSVNRQSLDENNYSITSREQAAFYFAGGKWWLVDRSELKTTFIQAKEPVELKDGDIIQMGDRRFIFHLERPEGGGGAGQ